MASSTTATDERLSSAAEPMHATVAGDSSDHPATLVHLAVDSDDPAGLVAAAARELGQPMGVVAVDGELLGHAPHDASGRRALAVAAAAARTRLVAPPGWRIVPITHAALRLGFLATGIDESRDSNRQRLLDLVATLLGEQLRRTELLRAQTATFVRRLVSDPHVGAERARQEAASLGLLLADAYRPAVLAWHGATPPPNVLERLAREPARRVSGGLTAMLDGRMVLLHPAGHAGANPLAWFGDVVERAQALAPRSGAQAVAAEADVALDELRDRIEKLVDLSRLGVRADPDRPVICAPDYALDRLLRDNVAESAAQSFVQDRLGAIIAWDREHGSGLLDVLEAALDSPRHDRAARRCFMHRNTFRHRLRQATQLLGDDLEDPDVRLGVHVALKLRRGLAAPIDRGGGG